MASYQNLFITKLPRTLTDTDLAEFFAPHRACSAKVMLDPTTGRSKGFGFILFATEEEGKAAFDAMNGTRLRVRSQAFNVIMQPSTHNGRTAAAESCALYVRNVPMSATQPDVEAMFRPYGTITNFAMRPDYHGNAVWVVYVEYETVESAKAALRSVHQSWTKFPGGSAAPILAKYAESDELKRERRHHRSDTRGVLHQQSDRQFISATGGASRSITPRGNNNHPLQSDEFQSSPNPMHVPCAFGDDDDEQQQQYGDQSMSLHGISGLNNNCNDGDDETLLLPSSASPAGSYYRRNPYSLMVTVLSC